MISHIAITVKTLWFCKYHQTYFILVIPKFLIFMKIVNLKATNEIVLKSAYQFCCDGFTIHEINLILFVKYI